MLNLIDYNYYSKDYGGSSIPEASFLKYSNDASLKIHFFTYNRITADKVTDIIKMTACQIAELYYSQQLLKDSLTSNEQTIASETVGPHSISYTDNKNIQAQQLLKEHEFDKECYRICYQNLAHTGLMYRGFNV